MSSEPTAAKRRILPPAAELWQIPGIIVAVAVFAIAGYVVKHPLTEASPKDNDFAALLQAYESGDALAAAGSAERFLDRYKGLSLREEIAARFIFADSKWTLTRADSSTTRKDLVDCLTSFRRVLRPELPPEQEAEALAAEGQIFLRLGQMSQALEVYTSLLMRHPEKTEALLDMALVYAGMNPPLIDKAGECVDKYLTIAGLSPEQIQKGYLTRAEVALRAQDFPAAVAAAAKVTEAGPAGEMGAQAVLLTAQALAAQGRHTEALAAIDVRGLEGAGRHEAALHLARATAQWLAGDPVGARKAMDEAIFRFPGTHEALSARYRLARLLFDSGDLDAARDALVSLLDDMSAQQAIGTDQFDVDDVSDLWYAVGQAIFESRDWQAARDYHATAQTLMTEGRFLYFDALLCMRQAEEAESMASDAVGPERAAAEAAANEAYRQAGEAFARVSRAATGDMYYESLWNAAHTLYRAGDYAAALHYIRTFREESSGDERTPQALLEEAQCLAALGNTEPAIAVCRANAERHPTNINAYRAILLQADLYRAMGGEGVAEAAALYQGILADTRFQAESSEWRRAIFSSGETLCELGRWRESILRLDEALARFPSDGEAPRARYSLATAYRQAAFEDGASKGEFFTRAAELFNRIADGGEGLPESLTRSAAFLEADCFYDMGDYTKALVLYSRAVEANVDTPDATRALFQIANCYHRLGSKEQADATYKRALFSLRRGTQAPEPGAPFYEALPRWRTGEEISG